MVLIPLLNDDKDSGGWLFGSERVGTAVILY